jgi:hypothetical protein
LCPSAYDLDRNRHRSAAAYSAWAMPKLRRIAAIRV